MPVIEPLATIRAESKVPVSGSLTCLSGSLVITLEAGASRMLPGVPSPSASVCPVLDSYMHRTPWQSFHVALSVQF